MKNPFHVMIVPTLGCPANCSYCWSSEEGSPVMSIETIKAIVDWLRDFKDEPVTFTFHGGEPLLAGPAFYREALPLLAEGLPHLTPEFALQTNLWRMTPEMAEVLAAYHVPIGSSIDGPKDLNDSQRGKGYFDKTMGGYEIAREHGLEVRFICTFTTASFERRDEIVDFFRKNGFPLKLHPALPSLRSDEPEQWALPPEKYGELLIYLLDKALVHLNDMEVMNINDLCRCVFTRHGSVCTFADCMGSTFAVGPDGGIYPCYRFVGMPEWVMGNVYDHPKVEDLAQSEAWQRMHAFKEFVDTACKDCRHITYCRGGCPYNAITPTGGEVRAVDPHCVAYRRIFDEITDRMNREMFASPPPGMGMGMPMGMGRGGRPGQPGPKTTPGVMSLIHRIVFR